MLGGAEGPSEQGVNAQGRWELSFEDRMGVLLLQPVLLLVFRHEHLVDLDSSRETRLARTRAS